MMKGDNMYKKKIKLVLTYLLACTMLLTQFSGSFLMNDVKAAETTETETENESTVESTEDTGETKSEDETESGSTAEEIENEVEPETNADADSAEKVADSASTAEQDTNADAASAEKVEDSASTAEQDANADADSAEEVADSTSTTEPESETENTTTETEDTSESETETTVDETTSATEDEPELDDDYVIKNDEDGIPDAALYAILLYCGDQQSGNSDAILTVGEAKNITKISKSLDDVKDFTNFAKYAGNLESISSFSVKNWSDDTIKSFMAEYEKFDKLSSITVSSINNQEFLDELCANTNLTYLDLSYLGSETEKYAIDLSECVKLQELSLSGYLSDVQGLDKISELRSLGIYNTDKDNEIKIDSLKNLHTGLGYIGLSGVAVESLKEDTNIPSQNSLGRLSIACKSLKNVDGISALENLYTLYLSDAQIESLGDIANITGLTYLEIADSKLTNIDGIENLTNLTEVVIHYNDNLTNINIKGNLPNLELLWLNDNNITDVTGIEKLPNLRLLWLNDNNITDVTGIEKLTSLAELYLNNNKLTTLPDITGLKLYELRLYGNEFKKEHLESVVPESFSSDKRWLAIATKVWVGDKLCYTYLDDQAILSTLNYHDSSYADFDILEGWPLELGTEFLEILKEKEKTVTIYVHDAVTGDKTYYVNVNGKTLPDAITDSVKVDELVKFIELPENLRKKYDAMDEDVEVIAYTVTENYPESGVAYAIELEDLDSEDLESNYVSLYFYDNNTHKSELIGESIDLGKYSSISWTWYNIDRSKMIKPESEGFYYIVNDKYGSLDSDDIDEPEVPSETETETPTETEPSTETPTESEPSTEAPTETEPSTEAPIESEPGTEVPTETEPSTEAPTESEPSTEAPTESESSTEAPTENGNSNAQVIAADKIVSADEAADKISSEMENSIRQTIDTIVDKPIVMSADLFEGMKKNNKSVTVGVVNDNNELQYSWSFDYQTIDPSKMADIDLSIKFETEKQKEIENITGQKNAFYISFAYHGALPGPAMIKTFVGNQYKDGEKVYLYYYNEDTGKIESNASVGLTVKDGYVTYRIDHCSVYFLSVDSPDVYGLETPTDNPNTDPGNETEQPTTDNSQEPTESVTEESQSQSDNNGNDDGTFVSPSTDYVFRPEVLIVFVLSCVMAVFLAGRYVKTKKSGK